MATTFADTTEYTWAKTEFSAFQEWVKDKKPERCWMGTAEAHLVIDWVIETNRNAGRRFFGCSLGKNPHDNPSVIDGACDFFYEYEKFLEHQYRSWLGGKMNDPIFVSDRDKGRQDGYWLQPQKSDSEGYLYGYREGVGMKRSEGYSIRWSGGADTPYLFP